MKELVKIIKINDNRVLKYNIAQDYVPTIIITEGFLEDGELKKSYTLNRCDDYFFSGWIDDEEIREVSYSFDKNHPLYIPFLHLINYDEILLIDDDDTNEENKKFVAIYKEEDNITLKFINNLEKEDLINKFNVFIKNICFDGRSKIDQQYKDTKERLHAFYSEVHERLAMDIRQASIEEYCIKNDLEQEAKVFKKQFNKR